MPKNLQKIGAYAFSGCTKINNIAIPPSIQEIGVYIFDDCAGLQALYYPDKHDLSFALGFHQDDVMALPYIMAANGYDYTGVRVSYSPLVKELANDPKLKSLYEEQLERIKQNRERQEAIRKQQEKE